MILHQAWRTQRRRERGRQTDRQRREEGGGQTGECFDRSGCIKGKICEDEGMKLENQIWLFSLCRPGETGRLQLFVVLKAAGVVYRSIHSLHTFTPRFEIIVPPAISTAPPALLRGRCISSPHKPLLMHRRHNLLGLI
ncbi:unnamed protein product [Pleuronectes platessa]|uniref:Uncharacterized protein n=1 Tax=Pleuronectes platessa TaxID=8262 RepID=A0A9N7Z5W0_PLEPL|nr:unnamed protein product [Pleuronectes platessa]